MASTHITLLCDRTASMQSIRSDAEGAVNAFLEEQRLVQGYCSLWLIDFDSTDFGTEAEPWFHTKFDGSIMNSKDYKLVPRGNTALFDAMAKAITETGRRLESIPESTRPERVIFVYQTDGMENSSRHTTLDALQAMIKHQEDVYSWVFIPLGSTPGAAEALSNIMSGSKSAGNVVAAAGTGHSHSAAHAHVSATVTNMRSAHSHTDYMAVAYGNAAKFDADGGVIDLGIKDEDKDEAKA